MRQTALMGFVAARSLFKDSTPHGCNNTPTANAPQSLVARTDRAERDSTSNVLPAGSLSPETGRNPAQNFDEMFDGPTPSRLPAWLLAGYLTVGE